MSEIQRLIEVVARLRDPEKGCPWDSVQTNMSIRSYLVEEAGEYLDALEDGDHDAMRDELGDILLQVVLNAKIAEDEGFFNIEDVARSEADKMIRRHPHVFASSDAKTEEEFRKQWDRIKSSEKGYDKRDSAMDGIPRSIPGLARAQKMLSRASRAGFDWPDIQGVLGKISEELDEVKEAVAENNQEHLSEELGDLLLAVVKLCHWNNIQAEEAMHASVKKYTKRYRVMEQELHKQGLEPANATIEQKVAAWKAAKKICQD